MLKNILSLILLVAVFLIGMNFPINNRMMVGMHGVVSEHQEMKKIGKMGIENMGEHRMAYLQEKDYITNKMRDEGKYKCCLEDSCTYCIEKTPGHGEGAECDCLSDIINGVHPCGECIGEILEGHGNKYLAEYFAVAIAEKVGEGYLNTLRQIIEDKYGLPVIEQL